MAQKKKKTPVRKAQSLSADTMAARLCGGLTLIVLGVVSALAVALQLRGVMFTSLRNLCCGLCGIGALALPAVLIWGGWLLIASTRHRVKLRTFGLTCLMLTLLLGAMSLLTFTGSATMALPDWLAQESPTAGGYGAMMPSAYVFGRERGAGGGFIGMALAWPLWKTLSAVPGGILCILLAVADLLFMLRIDWRKLYSRLEERWEEHELRAEERREERAAEREAREAERAAYVEEAERRRAAVPMRAVPQAFEEQAVYQNQRQQGMQPAFATAGQTPVGYGFQPTPEENRYVNEESLQPIRPHGPSRILSGATAAVPALTGAVSGLKGKLSKIWNPSPEAKTDYDKEEKDSALRVRKSARPQTPIRAEEDAWQTQPSVSGWTDSTAPVNDWTAPQTTPQMPVSRAASASGTFTAPYVPNETQSTGRMSAARPAGRKTAPMNTLPETPAVKPTTAPQTAAAEVEAEKPVTPWQRQLQQKMNQGAQPAAQPADAKEGRSRRAARHTTEMSKAELQQPTASWTDDEPLPWEDEVEQPKANILPPKDADNHSAWQPELRIKAADNPDETFGVTQAQPEPELPPYVFPDVSLLEMAKDPIGVSPEEDAMRARRLEETLASFKVQAKVRHITHGPAVSRFELELAPGINVNRVTNLGQNIAMNMEAKSVRIEAPIPGKSLVGIEIPNRKVATVSLREVLESQEMRSATKPLVVALGKDIAGTPITCDLAKMPHLLIAGATGSGKSVCINTIINSILFRCSPEDVRMILVDPKVVELSCYNGVPHLLLPVVSDPHKAAGALSWAVDEMMSRYDKFKTHNVRNIDGFNNALEPGEKKMPRIVIIIDELADLMMVCKRDVEERICRIAQLARAAGIHLIVATQRPSVDVITGLIKANIPSRIAFKVTSFVDSRTILDSNGADQLLGWGDMLYKPVGQFTATRIQGCFLSDNEVNNVVRFILATCPAHYDPEIIEQLNSLDGEETDAGGNMPSTNDFAGSSDGGDDKSLLMQCIEIAVEDHQVSTSMLQRRLRVGYARAGRLVDEMEKRGIVSQQDGSKPRTCLISREEFEQMKASGQLK